MSSVCPVGHVELGAGRPLAIIAGPCMLESEALALEVAFRLAEACAAVELPLIFKGSFDKANRTSSASPRGPGLDDGLRILERAREKTGAPVTTDVHHPEQARAIAEVVDLVQIPAFLCRQTDLIVSAAEAARDFGRGVNIKKGQFLSPAEMAGPVGKALAAGCERLVLTERGTFFGYHRLVNDFVGVQDLMSLCVDSHGPWPVCFDATHSTQRPGAGSVSGGRAAAAPGLARAAVALGVQAIFLECHPDPPKAFSDAESMLPLDEIPGVLRSLARVRRASEEEGGV